MEVTGRGEIAGVDRGDCHGRHDSWVGEDVTNATVRQKDCYAGADVPPGGRVLQVDAAFAEPVDGDLAHLVLASLCDEADAAAENGQVVREDRG